MHSMIIIVVGVPGCGKSSILKELRRQIPSLTILNYGDEMLYEAKVSRDELRKLPLQTQREMGIRAATRMVQQKQGVCILDTHALIRADGGFYPGLPKEVLKILNPASLVCIECSPSVILARRKDDLLRKRDQEKEEDLALHQEWIRSYLAACAMETGALLYRLSNESPSLEQNCQPLVEWIRKH